MNPISRILPLLAAAAALAHSQEAPEAASGDSLPAPATPAARILGEIPDGTPPPPTPPEPRYAVAPRDVLATRVHEQNGRTITLRQIAPIALPPPPPPAEPSIREVDEAFRQRLAAYRTAHPLEKLLFLGATVFRSQDSPPRTLVRCWPAGGREEITFWSSADFALIAGGIQSFTDAAGDAHSLFLGWGSVDLDRLAALPATRGRKYVAPEIPVFPEGGAVYQITGSPPAAADLVPIQALHDLYNREHDRLLTAWQGRERARIEREAYLKAHPPQPKDITLNYWRTEAPAANGKGESAR